MHLYETGVNFYFPKSVSGLPTSIMAGQTTTAPANHIQGDEIVLPTGHKGEPPFCFCLPLPEEPQSWLRGWLHQSDTSHMEVKDVLSITSL